MYSGYNDIPVGLIPKDQQEITIGGRHICELNARITDVVIGSCVPDVEVFQGVGRSSINVLKNRRTGRQLRLTIDYIGSPLETARNRSEFDLLFVGLDPVTLDLRDGYYYDVVLLSVQDETSIPGVCTTVRYTFAATKRGAYEELALSSDYGTSATFRSPGTYPKSDCIVTLSGALAGGMRWSVIVNDLWYSSDIEITDPVVINGVDKIITMGGSNITGDVDWSDWPYIVPGINRIQIQFGGGPAVPAAVRVRYAPVYL